MRALGESDYGKEEKEKRGCAERKRWVRKQKYSRTNWSVAKNSVHKQYIINCTKKIVNTLHLYIFVDYGQIRSSYEILWFGASFGVST